MEETKIKKTIFFPVYLDIRGKRVLVVGGGMIAQRKITSLLECGAVVFVVSRELTPLVNQYREEGRIKIIGREYEKYLLDNIFMVIAATDDTQLNHQISQDSTARGLLINAVDQPEDCNFIFPSVLKRGDLVLSISTSGKSPALARKIRERLEHEFGNEYARLLNIMGGIRKEVLSWGLPQSKNSLLFKELIDGPLPEAIRVENWDWAAEIIKTTLNKDYTSEQIKQMGEEN